MPAHTSRLSPVPLVPSTPSASDSDCTIACNAISQNASNLQAGTFFSPVPTDQILALTAARSIKRPDAMLLLALLSHKRRPDITEVRPRQDRLAELLACCVRTVQRGLERLEAAGLLVKRYRRDHLGRVHGLRYDLANTLALLPPTSGRRIPPQTDRPKATPKSSCPAALIECPDPPPKRPARRPESESDSAEIENNSLPTPPAPPVSPVVGELMEIGVFGRIAAQLVARHGAARCREVLAAVGGRKRIGSAPAWVCRCLAEDWDLSRRPTPAASRPQSQHPYSPPPISAPAPDPDDDVLAHLTPAAYAALERAARARLIAELPALRPVLEKGRPTPAVRSRMRLLLAEEATP
jgi:hypothetical protein